MNTNGATGEQIKTFTQLLKVVNEEQLDFMWKECEREALRRVLR